MPPQFACSKLKPSAKYVLFFFYAFGNVPDPDTFWWAICIKCLFFVRVCLLIHIMRAIKLVSFCFVCYVGRLVNVTIV